jgi:hypothetical protein
LPAQCFCQAWAGISAESASTQIAPGVLDTARGAAALALHPDTVHTLFHVAGLVDHQDRTDVAKAVDDVITQIIADRISVPASPCQQMLQPVGGDSAAVLGDSPAIFAVQARGHPGHQFTGMAHGLVTTEPRRDANQDAENSDCHRSGSTR